MTNAYGQDFDRAAQDLVDARAAVASMTPREQAEACWHPSAEFSIDELEDRYRDARGLDPLPRATAPGYIDELRVRNLALSAKCSGVVPEKPVVRRHHTTWSTSSRCLG